MSDPHTELRRRLDALEEENRALRARLAAPPIEEAPAQELLDAVLRTHVCAVLVFDPDGRVRWANERAERVLGLTRSALLERTYDDPAWRITAEDGASMRDEDLPFRRVRSSGAPVFDVRMAIEWPDGRRKVLSVNGAPLHDARGALRSLVFSVADVTDLLAAEQRARESEAALRAALSAARVGTWSWEVATGAVRWSENVEEIMGLAPGTFAGTYEAYLALVPDDERPRLLREIERSLAGESESYHVLHAIRPPGGERWLACRGDVVRDPGGRPVRMTGTVADVTDRKVLDEQLQRAARVESIARLAGGVAHDMNNVLTAVRGFVDLAAQRLPSTSPAAELLRGAAAAAEGGAALTRQLLTVARRQPGTPRTVDVGEVVRRAEPVLHQLLREDVELALELAPAPTPVSIDPGQLEQVLFNLATNARDAMPRGGRLVVRTCAADLDDAAARALPGLTPGAHVVLEVRDTGHGIAPEHLERLFEPFFTTKAPGKGTGLGLPACYGVVRERGGHIGVESRPGEGATFTIHLPRAPGPAEPLDAPAALPATPRLRGVVLVVEDEPLVRDMLEGCLRGAGLDVLVAPDGLAALERLRGHEGPLDLLVSDVVMPRLGGVALAAEVRSLRPGTRILLLSGYTDDADAASAASDAFLPKPFTRDDLLACVAGLLEPR
ncbi:MAG: PAS domain S-box protein [Planctomycetes bacterium]|nr:PAS domain S-box protein [Planctomycetota bacterium]